MELKKVRAESYTSVEKAADMLRAGVYRTQKRPEGANHSRRERITSRLDITRVPFYRSSIIIREANGLFLLKL